MSFGIDGTMTNEVDFYLQRLHMEWENLFPASELLATYYVVKIIRGLLGKGRIVRPDYKKM